MALLSTIEAKPKLQIKRYSKFHGVVHSEMFFNNQFICKAFENISFIIPPGTYLAFLFQSPKFKTPVWRLIVKGRLGIEIHPANFAHELRGCISPVSTSTHYGGDSSKPAFERLMPLIGKPSILVIEITEDFQV